MQQQTLIILGVCFVFLIFLFRKTLLPQFFGVRREAHLETSRVRRGLPTGAFVVCDRWSGRKKVKEYRHDTLALSFMDGAEFNEIRPHRDMEVVNLEEALADTKKLTVRLKGKWFNNEWVPGAQHEMGVDQDLKLGEAYEKLEDLKRSKASKDEIEIQNIKDLSEAFKDVIGASRRSGGKE